VVRRHLLPFLQASSLCRVLLPSLSMTVLWLHRLRDWPLQLRLSLLLQQPQPRAQSPAPVESTSVQIIPAQSAPVVASSSVSTPVAVSLAPAKTIVPVESASAIASSEVSIQTVVSTVKSSSVWVQTSLPVESTATIVPVEQTSSVLVSSAASTATAVKETTTFYSHSYVVPGNTAISSTLVTVAPTQTTTWANTTSTLPSSSSSCIATTLTGSSTSGNYRYQSFTLFPSLILRCWVFRRVFHHLGSCSLQET
jgi:hypothetical protein